MFQVSEIVALVLALALMPLMYTSVRNLQFAGKSAMAVGVALLIVSNVLTVFEAVLWPDVLNFMEHLALAGSAVGFAIGVLQLSAAERAAAGER